MRTEWNLLLQLSALLAFVLLRLVHPGWMLILLALTPLAAGVLGPSIMAAVVLRRQRLRRSVTVPFALDATLLLAAGLLLVDYTDAPGGDASPLSLALGMAQPPMWNYPLGNTLLFAFVASVLWTLVAVVVAARRPAARPVPDAGTDPRFVRPR